jgi:hypothetical protein
VFAGIFFPGVSFGVPVIRRKWNIGAGIWLRDAA